MKIFFCCIFVSLQLILHAQDGKLLQKTELTLSDSLRRMAQMRNPQLAKQLDELRFSKIIYQSDGLKVVGYVAEPVKAGRYPCIIANRGGNREFGKWTMPNVLFTLGEMASWGYVVVASQYRGNDGGEGKEEFGGKDVNDVLNLIPLLSGWPGADTARIGMWGHSRGGMMTYLSLRKTQRMKAAVVIAGAANAFNNIANRPDMETEVFAQLVPDYANNKQQALIDRSAVYWADQLCKTTPLLIIHGSADWRVTPAESMEMMDKLYKAKHPVRFILYEGADHSIREFMKERWAETRQFFDRYLRDGMKWPGLEPHGD